MVGYNWVLVVLDCNSGLIVVDYNSGVVVVDYNSGVVVVDYNSGVVVVDCNTGLIVVVKMKGFGLVFGIELAGLRVEYFVGFVFEFEWIVTGNFADNYYLMIGVGTDSDMVVAGRHLMIVVDGKIGLVVEVADVKHIDETEFDFLVGKKTQVQAFPQLFLLSTLSDHLSEFHHANVLHRLHPESALGIGSLKPAA